MAMHYHIEIRPKTLYFKSRQGLRAGPTRRGRVGISTSPQKKHPAAKE